MNENNNRLVVVSNRLPISMSKDGQQWKVHPSSGGLVTALNPVMKLSRGEWVGWVGTEWEDTMQAVLDESSSHSAYDLVPVQLSAEDEDLYYRGYANETIWPLFHDLLGYCKFDRRTWQRYVEVNRRFATIIQSRVRPDDIVWIHDYQLLLAGTDVRGLGVDNPLVFFLHIPFPSPDLYRRLPQRREIIEAMIQCDLVGLQTLRDRRNFVACVRDHIEDVTVRVDREFTTIEFNGHTTIVGDWPISIDFHEFSNYASSREVAESAKQFHEHFRGKKVFLGVDRLDYTKGIPERFLAFERLIEKYPDVHERVSLCQVLVPSRTHVPDYQNLKQTLDTLVGRINGRYSQPGWVPLHYEYHSLDRRQLLARYRSCEFALISPLRDGMNLVAKEYCASCVDNRGVLILSEFAGAADQLGKHALLVNPFDLEQTADAMYQAFTMSRREQQRRMKLLRNDIRRDNVFKWVDSILHHLPNGVLAAI